MRRLRYLIMLGMSGAAVLTMTGGAGAASLAQTSNLPAQTIPFETTMQFDRFDSSFGNLTDVIIRGTSRIEVGVDVFNSTSAAQGFQ
ncbi:MAG: hypothetical protein JWN13_675, partial [Betaproteobacteria bacterium]|nr:hypothetical protein [Betaproteobacteria bacterium]